MYIVKGYVFYHNEKEDIVTIKLSDMMKEPFKVKDYKEGHEFFEGVPYYMFLLSPIKEKEEAE